MISSIHALGIEAKSPHRAKRMRTNNGLPNTEFKAPLSLRKA